MRKLVTALLQILPGASEAENLVRGMTACREAKRRGADIALFPEMWSCGYRVPEDAQALRALSVPADGAFVSAFGRLAAELDMDRLRAYRESEVHGNAYRRPTQYRALLDEEVRAPFVRADSRRWKA